MTKLEMEKVMAKADNNVYKLVILASKRVRQLKEGSPKLIKTDSQNPTTIALEEIAAGKIGYKEKNHRVKPTTTQ